MEATYEKSLALHAEVAEKLKAQPELVARAQRKLEEWLARGGRSAPLLLEWQAILEGPFDALLAFLVERSEHAAWLRSASPFAGFLAPREREAILRAVRLRTVAARTVS